MGKDESFELSKFEKKRELDLTHHKSVLRLLYELHSRVNFLISQTLTKLESTVLKQLNYRKRYTNSKIYQERLLSQEKQKLMIPAKSVQS